MTVSSFVTLSVKIPYRVVFKLYPKITCCFLQTLPVHSPWRVPAHLCGLLWLCNPEHCMHLTVLSRRTEACWEEFVSGVCVFIGRHLMLVSYKLNSNLHSFVSTVTQGDFVIRGVCVCTVCCMYACVYLLICVCAPSVCI